MDMRIAPGALCGSMRAVSSKSDAHRLFICAALADGPSTILLHDISDDIRTTISCLRALGAQISENKPGEYLVDPIRQAAHFPVLNCGESGSTLRFLLPVAAALTKNASIAGSGRLPQRPLGPLVEQMALHGCAFSSEILPFTVSGGLCAGTYRLPGNVSSQFVSGLLFALCLLKEDSAIELTSPLESAGYVDMTIKTMGLFGIAIGKNERGYSIRGGQAPRGGGTYAAEADWSNAAFFLVAGALGGDVSLGGLDFSSLQSDRAIVGLLERFGARLAESGDTLRVQPSQRQPLTIDAAQCPDLFPVLAVLACGAKGATRIGNAARLRLKESDRIEAVARMLDDLGGRAEQTSDSLIVHGAGALRGGVTDSFNDHRIAMAAAVASILCREEVVIKNAQAVSKSYPKFFEDFNALGGKANVGQLRQSS